jgi:hypothetical protein
MRLASTNPRRRDNVDNEMAAPTSSLACPWSGDPRWRVARVTIEATAAGEKATNEATGASPRIS